MATKITTPVGIGDELKTTAAHGVTVRASGVYDFTEDKFQSEINAEVGAIALDWNTDIATTRNQVISEKRKRNLIISYTTLSGDNITEKYIGTEDSIDTEWTASKNWARIANADSKQIDYSDDEEYEEGSIGKALSDLKKEVIKDEKVSANVLYKLDETQNSHLANKNNPHEVTKIQVGLGNADNTSDYNKPISTAQQTALNKKADRTDVIQVWNTLNGSDYKDLREIELWGDQTCTYRPIDTKEGTYPDIIYALIGKTISTDENKTVSFGSSSGSFSLVTLSSRKIVNEEEDQLTNEEEDEIVTNLQASITLTYYPTSDTTKFYQATIIDSDIAEGEVIILTKSDTITEGSIVGKPVSFGDIVTPEGGLLKAVSDHHSDTSNPHNVTKAQVGLENVDNTSDTDKPVSTLQQEALDKKIDKSVMGQPSGVATLDTGGKVPKSQLPTYLADDIEEYESLAKFPETGETGKAYIDLSDSEIYRWSALSKTYIKTSAFAHDELDSKVDKVEGKGLSTEDLTTDRKNHLETLWNNLGGNIFFGEVDEEADIKIYNKTQVDYLLSLKASRAELKEYMEKFDETYFMYGIEWDTSNSSPDATRIGNTNFHKTLPIHSSIRGCRLSNTGEVLEYLPVNATWENREYLDGTGESGMVMIEIPRFYWKFETEGTIRRVKLSTIPLEDYIEVPKCYISAYEATLNREALMLASVKNSTSTVFRGGNNNSDYDYTYRSLLGKPVSGLSMTDLRGYARKRGDNWNIMTYQAYKELYWLFAVEYATLNSQKAINSELTSEGYHQGGLGEGPTQAETYTTWTTYNNNNPIIPCGWTDSFGGGTGEKTYIASGPSGSAIFTVTANRYRGIENPFGHLWCLVDGIHAVVPSESAGVSQIYISDYENSVYWNDSDNTGYYYSGNTVRESGWVKDIIFGEKGDIICSSVGGGNTIYYCDYFSTVIPSSGTPIYEVMFGGSLSDGLSSGFLSQGISMEPGTTGKNYIGTRLIYIP